MDTKTLHDLVTDSLDMTDPDAFTDAIPYWVAASLEDEEFISEHFCDALAEGMEGRTITEVAGHHHRIADNLLGMQGHGTLPTIVACYSAGFALQTGYLGYLLHNIWAKWCQAYFEANADMYWQDCVNLHHDNLIGAEEHNADCRADR